MEELIAFPKIEQIGKLYMTITQKLHGTNAQIMIEDIDGGHCGVDPCVRAGSRSRWLTPEDDNHGFARWVKDNEAELYCKLGLGRHYGEWCGKGINAGEGLSDKRFYLFNWRRYRTMPLPDRVHTVPVLFTGKFDLGTINIVMDELEHTGSHIVPGYMKPEGIVIEVDGKRYKKVFDDEVVKWSRPDETREKRISNFDASPYLQPLRLEKLLSRDEKYTREYPESLPQIVKDYIQDLVDEKQIPGDEDEIQNARKCMARAIFNFVKSTIAGQ